MATVAVAQTQSQPSRGPGKQGKGKGNRRGGGRRPAQGAQSKTNGEAANAPDDEDRATCWICAEPVKYYAVSECNHRTCHVCSLRLRALYKKKECTFCKEPQTAMVVTTSADAVFTSFDTDTENMPFKDAKLSMVFETQEMMEETLLLLRFNCPDPECEFIGNSWSDIKLHVRATHGQLMCDLCIRQKKVPPNIIPLHLPSMLPKARPGPARGKAKDTTEQIEGGVHPLCQFCRECFFGDDEMYRHMRETHEECFVCKRNDVRDQYFMDYAALETHFTRDHFPCPHLTCLARKFVVYGSALDLKAHAVEDHGGELGKGELRDARRIEAVWDTGGGHGRGRGRGRERERARDRDREEAPRRRREGFGAQLTVEGESSPAPTPTPTPSPPDVNPAIADRHSTFLSRLASLAPNPTTAVPAANAAIRSFRGSESSARDLISTLYTIVDSRMDAAASVVNALVDLFDDAEGEGEQREAVLDAWRDFEVAQRQQLQFPDLVVVSVTIPSGRVLTAKHATTSRGAVWDRVAQAATAERFPALGSGSGSGARPAAVAAGGGQRNTPWSSGRPVAPTGFAASSSFVPPSAPPAKAVVVPRSKTVASGGGWKDTPKHKLSTVTSGWKVGPPPSSALVFPELPTTTRQKTGVAVVQVKGNQSLQNILGRGSGSGSAWVAGGAGSGTSSTPVGGGAVAAGARDDDAGVGVGAGAGGGRKGKGKNKQTLFTLGTFAS
ncbi:hypothetical protein C8F01DRAFT_1378644 [Mycena amicta]|nr:hypothetical protein C8F01DRAFT_1378644 [Mycena amicta]